MIGDRGWRAPLPRAHAAGRVGGAQLKAHFSDEAILEMTDITCLDEMHAIISQALRLESDDRDDPIVEVAGDPSSLAADVGTMISRNDA